MRYLEIATTEYSRVKNTYRLVISDEYIDGLVKFIKSRMVNPDTLPTIDIDYIERVMKHTTTKEESNAKIEAKDYNNTSYFYYLADYVEELITDDVYECGSDMEYLECEESYTDVYPYEYNK